MRIKTLGWRNHPRNHVSFKGCNLNLNNVMVQDAVFWCLFLPELELPIYYGIISPLDCMIQNMHEFCLFLTQQKKKLMHVCLVKCLTV